MSAVKSKFAGLLRGLLRHFDDHEPEPANTFESAAPAAPAAPPAGPKPGTMLSQTAEPPVLNAQSQPAAEETPVPSSPECIELPPRLLEG